MFKISKKHRQLTMLLGTVLASLSTIANANTQGRQVIAAGGGYMVAGDYKLAYTIGQPIISTTINTPLVSGFWRRQKNNVSLGVEADSVSASACQNFDVTIQVQAPDTQAVDSVSAYINFDTNVLKVVKIKPATTLDFTLQNQFNNATGHIDFSAATLSPTPPKGTFDLMTITFSAKKEANQTGLVFNSTGQRTTDVLLGAVSVFANADDVTFPLEKLSTLAGKVSLKNHPLRVHVSPPTPETFYQVTTNNNGHFTLQDNFAPGTYDVYVAASNTLQVKKTATVAACQTKTLLFGTLKAGDVIGAGPTPPDNRVGIHDFGAFKLYLLNKPIPTLDYNLDGVVDAADSDVNFRDALFDLNYDKVVGANDVKAIQANFDQLGDDKVGGPYVRKALRDSKPIVPQSHFEATVSVQVAQPIDAVSAHLSFDTNVLQVTQIIGSDRFDTPLQSEFDNSTGDIYFAAGQLAEETPSGTIELMTIQFTAQNDGEQTLAIVETNIVSGAETVSEEAEDITLKEVVPEEPGCQIYAVQDGGLNNSQFFTINPNSLEVKAIGNVYQGYDIEALDAHPETDILYAGAGDNTENPGHLYTVNPQGVLTKIGDTGFDEIEALTFHPNGKLWGWAKGDGLITITLPPEEIDAQLVFSSDVPIEGLTWNNDGTLLYAAEDTNLWKSDGETIEKACDLPGHTEALEMLPNNLLLIGVHGNKNIFEFKIMDLATCDLVQGVDIPTQYNDIEGIAFPEKACAAD
jgi:hypothetical protein